MNEIKKTFTGIMRKERVQLTLQSGIQVLIRPRVWKRNEAHFSASGHEYNGRKESRIVDVKCKKVTFFFVGLLRHPSKTVAEFA